MKNSENQESLSDGLSLHDLMTFAWRYRLALLGGAFIGGSLGLGVAFTLPAQWEAVALLQVAQLGGTGPVEPPVRVVERVMQDSFREDVVRRMGVSPKGVNLKAGKSFGSFKSKVEKSDLIGLSVRGFTPEATVRLADTVVAQLASEHAKMMDPAIDRWRKELDEVDQGLKQANREAERLSLLLGEQWRTTNGTNLYQAVIASNILLSREANLRALRERKRVLQEQLSPERTFPTAPLGRIEISRHPVSPKKHLFFAAGLLIGLFMGISLSVLRHVNTRRSPNTKPD